MAKVLRTKSHPDFSTKGVTLTKEEADQDLIEIWNEAESALDPSDLTDQSFDLDVNSISVNGTNLFPNNDPQDLGIGDEVEFNSININGNEFVDSSRNVSAGTGSFSVSSPSTILSINRTDIGATLDFDFIGGETNINSTNIYSISFNGIERLEIGPTSYFRTPLELDDTLTINSQELFTLGQEQRLSEDATPEFANITISGNDVATETWVSANFDDYSNWTLQDDGGSSNAISSGYTVVITGGENLETSSSSVSNTTTLTIDLSTNFVPETGGTFTGLVTFDSGIKLENTAVPFLDIQVTDNTDNGVIRFQDDGGATIASIETDGFDGAGAGYVNLADAWRVGDEPIASETWVDNNFDNYSNWNIQTDDGVAENVVSNDSVHILGGTDITTTDTTTGSTTEVTINWTGSYPVTSVFGETGDITAEASHYNSFFYEQSYIDSNFDNYSNWNVQTDDGVLENIVSSDNVYILGGTDIVTSDTTTGSTTEITIDFTGNYPVTSVFGETGDITASASHYNSFFYEQSYIDSNFDDYTNWTLLDDSGSSHAVSSGYNVQILGGTDISTSSTSTSNTTSFTIDFDGDYVPTSGGTFSGNVNVVGVLTNDGLRTDYTDSKTWADNSWGWSNEDHSGVTVQNQGTGIFPNIYIRAEDSGGTGVGILGVEALGGGRSAFVFGLRDDSHTNWINEKARLTGDGNFSITGDLTAVGGTFSGDVLVNPTITNNWALRVVSNGSNSSGFWDSSGNMHFYLRNSTGAVNTLLKGGSGEHSYIANGSGRLGINTTSPATTLDVNGNLTADGATFSGGVDIQGYIEANNGDSITSNPPSVDSTTGWKIGLYDNRYWMGVAGSTFAVKADSWFSVFGSTNPASDGGSNPDSNAGVSLNGDTGEVVATGNVDINKDEAILNLGIGSHTGEHGLRFYDSDNTVGLAFVYRTTPEELLIENGIDGTQLFSFDKSGVFTAEQGEFADGLVLPSSFAS